MSPLSMSPLSPGSPLSSGLSSPATGMNRSNPAQVSTKIHSRRFREWVKQGCESSDSNLISDFFLLFTKPNFQTLTEVSYKCIENHIFTFLLPGWVEMKSAHIWLVQCTTSRYKITHSSAHPSVSLQGTKLLMRSVVISPPPPPPPFSQEYKHTLAT